LNLISLGAQVTLCSVIGNDRDGDILTELIEKKGISSEGIVKSNDRKTTVKTRILGNNQQLLRIDSEQTNDISTAEELALLNKIDELIKSGVDALIFEDYNKGTLSKTLIHQVIEKCNTNNIITTVDPKKKNFFEYQGVTLFKPNLKELKEGLNVSINVKDKQSFDSAVSQLRAKLKHKITFITLSEHGVYIKDEHADHHIPAHLRNIADVSGAGDTVISVATLCLSAGLPIELVASISNLAGGLVCEKSGVVSIDKEELLRELNG
jgi:D-glycero-beta-D-manno-heptose-7-phosphate kinase